MAVGLTRNIIFDELFKWRKKERRREKKRKGREREKRNN